MNTIVEVATREIGTKEVPINSNHTKYGEWFGLQGVAWCGIFISWCYAMAGRPLGNIGYRMGFAGCQSAYQFFLNKGLIVTKDAHAQPGDIVLFDWNGDSRYDHTGLFVSDCGDGIHFNSIEGNTAIGNDSNGGEVMARKRPYSLAIFIHIPEKPNQNV